MFIQCSLQSDIQDSCQRHAFQTFIFLILDSRISRPGTHSPCSSGKGSNVSKYQTNLGSKVRLISQKVCSTAWGSPYFIDNTCSTTNYIPIIWNQLSSLTMTTYSTSFIVDNICSTTYHSTTIISNLLTRHFSSRFSGLGIGGVILNSLTIPTHSNSLTSSPLLMAALI